MKTRKYYLVNPQGYIICRIRLCVELRHIFLAKFPKGHKLMRHINKLVK